MPLAFNPVAVVQSSVAGKYKFFVISSNSTSSFALDDIADDPGTSQVFLNGLKQRHGTDYNINGSVLNWLGSSFRVNWLLEIYY
ncbi:MAG: hypothetical protein KME46_32400 [Brasilonema angustatum HA4187-MV1]|jgi:hypothetical protein|nr:hypothetical protein [Brasilonema angustatum HA4187-MV1]